MKINVNENMSIKSFILVTILMLIVGLILLYIGTKNIIEVNILKISKIETAEITFSERRTPWDGDHNNASLWIKYTYNINGIQYEDKNNIWWKKFSEKRYTKGEKIKIYYRVKNPQKSNVYHTSYFLIVLAILFLVSSPLFLIKKIKMRIRKREYHPPKEMYDNLHNKKK